MAGGSSPFALRNPYLGITFVIALQGVFPSRG
jgi:microcystin-dependent protein